jgi:hypothetical protein
MAWKLKGGEAGDAAFVELVAGEAQIVMVYQRLVQRVVGILGLDQHFAGQGGAPATAADLHQLREETFRGAEIGSEQRGVGADRTD